MYPVRVYQSGVELPKEGTYFVVAGNGLWKHADTGIINGFVSVDKIGCLDDFPAAEHCSLECKLPKLPSKEVWQIKTFFKKVVEKYHSEANVVLYFNKTLQNYIIYVPPQTVSHAGVRYRKYAFAEETNYLCAGTIHSHCDFGAFHSGVDQKDEENFDGLHITFGHNDRDEFSISASIVLHGRRDSISPLDVLEGIELVGDKYRLLQVAPEIIEVWSKDLDGWMDSINATTQSIRKGDTVAWAGELTAVSFRDICGEGPFTVDSVENQKATIQTKIGLAQFSELLFRKV